jgi:ATP-dependent Lon protease
MSNNEISKNRKRNIYGDFVTNDRLPLDWIAASKTRNSALDDKCLDYFEMFNVYDITDRPQKKQRTINNYENKRDENPLNASSFTDYILRCGIQFEKKIIEQLENKYSKDFIKICEPYEAVYFEKYRETIDAMNKGIPIIHQAIVYNPNSIVTDGDDKTFGAVDLLIRSDYLNKIINHSCIDDEESILPSPTFNSKYHYRVVDIKWTKLHFNVNLQTLRNNLNVKPFKTQLTIYNEALGSMQGYKPPVAYILGNGWVCERTRKGTKIVTKSSNPFDRLGKIDFVQFDKEYSEKASDAVIWYRSLQNQNNFDHDPPNCTELYPNMNNSMDGKFHHIKGQIADKYHEITQLWNCGTKEREIAFDNGVKSWHDKNFSSEIVGLKPGKKQKVIDAIVTLNRDSTSLVHPEKIINNYSNWQDINQISFYVDFETIQENMAEIPNLNGDYIFMIGLKYKKDNNFEYINLIVKELTLSEERNIINQFFNIVDTCSNQERNIIFHWGQHERTVLSHAIARHGNIWRMPNLVDFCRIMTDEPILVRGAYNFSLKTVAKAMYKHGMINVIWGNDMADGASAMFLGWREYTNKQYQKIEESHVIQKIMEYNRIDCETMYEIIKYFQHKEINIINEYQDNMADNNETTIVIDLPAYEEPNETPKKRTTHPVVSKSSDEEKPPKKSKIVKELRSLFRTVITDATKEVEISEASDEELPSEKPKEKRCRFKRLRRNPMRQPTPCESEESEDDDFVVADEDVSEDIESSSDEEEEEEEDGSDNILELLIKKVFDVAGKKYAKDDKFMKIKEILIKRMVTLDDLHDLENVTDDEKASLVEKYLSYATTQNIEELVHARDDLKNLIRNYSCSDLKEREQFEETKKQLENCKEDILSLEKRVLLTNLELPYKKIIYNKYKQLASMPTGTDTYAKLKEWIENAIRIPYNTMCPIKPDDISIGKYLKHIETTLNENLFGMKEAKEELLMILNNKLRNPESFKNTIALVGPPGTGKTALVMALCKALSLPFSQISLGGKHDASFFLGHSYTYEGSRPGQIVSSLQQMECKNGILFFDEFDKLEERNGVKGVSHLLLHITDFTQNDHFNDEYIADIPIDLSKLWYIFSLNDVESVDPILRNRMTFIHVSGYSEKEKVQIMSDYIVPKCMKSFQFNSDDITFTPEVIKYIIQKTSKEDGVREIERSVMEIFKKINLLRTIYSEMEEADNGEPPIAISFNIKGFKLPLTLTRDHIDILLKEEKREMDRVVKESMLYL